METKQAKKKTDHEQKKKRIRLIAYLLRTNNENQITI